MKNSQTAFTEPSGIFTMIPNTFLVIWKVRICADWWLALRAWKRKTLHREVMVTRFEIRLHFAFGKINVAMGPYPSPNTPPACWIWFFESPKRAAKKQIPERVSAFLVTRWRFELQTHCLKGNCSANWASESNGWDGRIWTYECQSQSLVPYRLATSQWNAARIRTHGVL